MSFIILLVITSLASLYAQSPHERDLKLDCSVCHNSNNWNIKFGETKFQHETTGFSLIDQHALVNCRSCHESLIFKQAESDCNTCHIDIHQETVGLDCSVCHTPKSWMVEDINGLHQESRFPLLGIHLIADCEQCHSRYVDLYFEPLKIDCYSCHLLDYNSTNSPNHIEAGFSTDCEDCHSINSESWAGASIIHDFFPLLGGHAIQNCFACHEQGGNFSGLSQDCFTCHQQNFEATQDPNHIEAGFSTDCVQCHTIFNWSSANFDHNQTAFPLTGKHISVNCSDCHSDGFSGTPTDCYACHQQDYESVNDPNHLTENFPTDCIQCHTTNDWGGAEFDHNQTNFPLTGSHITVDCSGCHTNGFSGTPAECYVCHQTAYELTNNPNHVTLALPTNCEDCHTTDPNWQPASFSIHGQFYQLFGAHSTISEDCNTCHNGDYNNTPNTCFGCHEDVYNATTDPPHQALNFSQDCIDCHDQSGWIPANFDHDGQYFPIYTGKHAGTWIDCTECHTVPDNYSVFSCIDCHEHRQSEMDDKHSIIDGYAYESNACFSCHPTGEKEGAFNHALSNFPLTGAHTTVDCLGCHENGYSNTPIDCVACHQQDYNQSTNPNHQVLVLSTECGSCHTIDPNWQPASFSIHDQYYLLEGGHQLVANDCISCHNGDYNNTTDQCYSCHQNNFNNASSHVEQNFPTNCEMCHNFNVWNETSFDHANTNFPLTGAHQTVDCSFCHESGYAGTSSVCNDCHQTVYQQSANPDHVALALSTDCEDCHTTIPNWQPATFSIHGQFYQLFGAHTNISNDCSTCHNGDYNNTPNTCFGCHEDDYKATTDPPHQVLSFSQDCVDCHDQSSWIPANFDHSNTNFPLTGEHQNILCSSCHQTGYTGTTTICYDCHQTAFEQTINPDHVVLALPTDCKDCHTTTPNWQPATFQIHGQFYQLFGAHANISNDCSSCHNGDYNNTPNTCFGCHDNEYNGTNDPPHQTLNFSLDCIECHNQGSWVPANFDHNFYPVSGHHDNVNCNECHSEPGYQPQCLDCHQENFLAGHNSGDPTDCWSCHTTFDWSTGGNIFKMKRRR